MLSLLTPLPARLPASCGPSLAHQILFSALILRASLLLPEEVDFTLAEMRRVAVPRGRFIFSICTRPSTTTVAGEGLHPTVRPLDWWLERIARVGVASRPKAGSRYIVGRFKSDGGCCGA